MKEVHQPWTTKQVEALLSAWTRQPADVSVHAFSIDFAASVGRTSPSVRSKLTELLARHGGNIPTSSYGEFDHQLRIEGDAFVLMDAHVPYHHAEFLNRCMEACRVLKVGTMILGGDALDLHAFNKFPETFEDDEKRVIDSRLRKELIEIAQRLPAKERMELEDKIANAETESGNVSEEIRESRKVLRAFEQNFERVFWVMGNHEQRVTRILEKTLDAVSLAVLFGADSPKWMISGYFWCELLSGGVKWQIEHPLNTGKGSSKKLAPKFQCNVVMGHNHHFSMTTDPSGNFLAVEPGMGGDEDRMGYTRQRHNAADVHMVGAVIIRNGKPILLNRFTDWDIVLKRT